MKVTIAQLNPTVGDIKGNLQKIIGVLSEFGNNTDLLVFSELFLVGYPPQDLLERSWFINEVNQALEELAQESSKYEAGIIVGAPRPTGKENGKGLTNSAILIHKGSIIFTQGKSLLPTYDVFDEARHFEPAPETGVVRFKDEVLGISICEDVWNDSDLCPGSLLYEVDPVSKLADSGATLLINISASPFYLGKEELRFRLIQNHARRCRTPFIFVNQVGANDELIFDGGSMAFDRAGDPIYLAPYFKEEIQEIDVKSPLKLEFVSREPIKSLYSALTLGVRDYLRKCGFQKAVIGLSGGIDSALTCCLAVDALGKENVLGISMPSLYSSVGSVEDSRKLAENLGIDFKVIPINPIFNSYLAVLAEHFTGLETDSTEENIQARIRGNILMAFSNKFGSVALSTGNKSEIAVGYCTLYGDMSGGLSVISDVPKTVVYELAEFVNRNKERIPKTTIDKVPSAELKPDQKDQDTLPPYPILDRILQYYVEDGYSVADIIALDYDPETVMWVARTVDRNEYKRRQAAPGLKVSSKAFGFGRRMPVAKKLSY